jgi:hypothetical protein
MSKGRIMSTIIKTRIKTVDDLTDLLKQDSDLKVHYWRTDMYGQKEKRVFDREAIMADLDLFWTESLYGELYLIDCFLTDKRIREIIWQEK